MLTTEREYLKPSVQEEIVAVPILTLRLEEPAVVWDERGLLDVAIRELGVSRPCKNIEKSREGD